MKITTTHDEKGRVSLSKAVFYSDGKKIEGIGSSRVADGDEFSESIGRDLSAGRALIDLGQKLTKIGFRATHEKPAKSTRYDKWLVPEEDKKTDLPLKVGDVIKSEDQAASLPIGTVIHCSKAQAEGGDPMNWEGRDAHKRANNDWITYNNYRFYDKWLTADHETVLGTWEIKSIPEIFITTTDELDALGIGSRVQLLDEKSDSWKCIITKESNSSFGNWRGIRPSDGAEGVFDKGFIFNYGPIKLVEAK